MINIVKQNGFTLAEVLISVAIIGVVAAMTIPTLIHKYQARVLEVQFKKSISLINQVVQRAKYELEIDNFSKFCQNEAHDIQCYDAISSALHKTSGKTTDPLFKTNFRRSFSNFKTYNGNEVKNMSACQYSLVYTNELTNGIYLGAFIGCGRMMTFGVDTNGSAKPNRFGHDIFVFSLNKKDDTIISHYGETPNTKSDEQAEEYYETLSNNPNKEYYRATYGAPCNITTKRSGNGLSCAYYALKNKCPYEDNKTYWECLPK